jgi:hypothetical protein
MTTVSTLYQNSVISGYCMGMSGSASFQTRAILMSGAGLAGFPRFRDLLLAWQSLGRRHSPR